MTVICQCLAGLPAVLLLINRLLVFPSDFQRLGEITSNFTGYFTDDVDDITRYKAHYFAI